MKKLLTITFLIIAAIMGAPVAMASHSADGEVEEPDPKEIIFEHLGDRYGWEVPFCHDKTIPLPIIVFGSDGLHIFSSSRVEPVTEIDENGEEIVRYKEYVDGNTTFRIAEEGSHKGKVVEIVDGKEIKPFDISITKNVLAIFIALIVILLILLPLARYSRRSDLGAKGYKAPRRFMGAIEALTAFIYEGVVKSTLKENAKRFAPYLLTVFYFIFIMNLLGLIVIFPGGANLTGNIAVTLVLAVLTFLVTNIFGTKHYWKEIFWPDVPLWLKFPLPIMPVIEIFGMFTKPAALTVRLFANMMGGHMIVIVLTLLIFIFFAKLGAAVAGGTAVVSLLFSIFMLLIDVLVSFIQAYVFTMLSTIFISLAQERHEEHKEHEAEKHEAKAIAAEALKEAETEVKPVTA